MISALDRVLSNKTVEEIELEIDCDIFGYMDDSDDSSEDVDYYQKQKRLTRKYL